MADTFHGVNIGAGASPANVLSQASTTSRTVELRVTNGVAGMSKTELLKAVEAIRNKIVTGNAPA